MVRGSYRFGLPVFLFGVLAGILCTIAVILWAAFHLADWLVVDGEIRPADVAVVLGGGGGNRLRRGLELYDQGLVDALVLVDTRARYWDGMLARWCPDCRTGDKPVTILTGSTSTWTDAQLVHAYCVKKGIERILVVTDPYHSRRAFTLFKWRFAGSGFHVTAVNSGDYRHLLLPTGKWWHDEATAQRIVMEAVGIAAFFLSLLSDPE